MYYLSEFLIPTDFGVFLVLLSLLAVFGEEDL